MGIFDNDMYLNPKYNHLEKYVHTMWKGFWTPAKYEKLIHEVDAPYYHNSMNEIDKSVIYKCILAVSTVEDKVKTMWNTLCLDIPQTVVGDVGGVFGNSEVIHRRAYHSLAEDIGVDISKINEYVALNGRLNYLNKHLQVDPKIIGKKRVLKKLTLFTALVERCSLFSQFYILMSFAKNNRGLKSISALQQSTASEEILHYSFGLDLINIIKDEYPQIWDDYLVELISKSIGEAYKAEINLLDWFFSDGVPSHITKKEVVNFINFNFNEVCKDLSLDIRYDFDKELYENKNSWMMLKLYSTHPDFFDNNVGGYSFVEEDIDLDNFEF